MNKGFITTILGAILGAAVVFAGLGTYFYFKGTLPEELAEIGVQVLTVHQGGTGESEFASTSLIAGNGTSKLFSTSTPTFQLFHATSTTATSSIRAGLTVGDLWVTAIGGIRASDLASCDTIDTDSDGVFSCGSDNAGTADLQDVYNSSASDAQITSATAKDIVLFLSNTDSNATFQVLSGTNGEGQLQIGTADGSATTTTGVWAGYGGLGIGTTSPGAGLAVSATSTILGGPAYILDHLRTSYIISTSTTNNSFGGALDVTEAATSTFTGGVATAGLSSSAGLVLSAGDLLMTSGRITLAGASTSTLPALNVSTALAVLGLTITGDLNHEGSGTSTFAGGLDILTGGLQIAAGGLDITGDSLFSGKLTSAAGTSTLPSLSVSTNLTAVNLLITGDLNVDTGTSTLQGATFTGLYTTGGIHVDTGDSLFDQTIKVGSGTSTFDGTLRINSGGTGTSTLTSLLLTGGLLGNKSVVGGISSTTADAATTTIALSCSGANLHTVIIDGDERLIFEDECWAGQVLRIWIDVRTNADGGEFQIDWDGLPDANGEYGSSTLMFREATTTTGYLEQGKMNRCQVEFMSPATTSAKATYGLLECNLGYGWR